MTPPPLLEICVDSLDGALAAERGGADRIELCADLVIGGTTPSHATVALACTRCTIPVAVMIRPRAGDFCYTTLEHKVMLGDVREARRAGAAAVVLGVLREDGTIAAERMAELAAAARPMQVTCHRAFDMTRDPFEALDALIALGVDRVLTSGQAASVPDGLELLARLVERAGHRIVVMPGAGIDERNIRQVAERTRARELHLFAGATIPSGMRHQNPRPMMGATALPSEYEILVTDEDLVRRAATALRGG